MSSTTPRTSSHCSLRSDRIKARHRDPPDPDDGMESWSEGTPTSKQPTKCLLDKELITRLEKLKVYAGTLDSEKLDEAYDGDVETGVSNPSGPRSSPLSLALPDPLEAHSKDGNSQRSRPSAAQTPGVKASRANKSGTLAKIKALRKKAPKFAWPKHRKQKTRGNRTKRPTTRVIRSMKQDGTDVEEIQSLFETGFTDPLLKMMFVSGETAEPSTETTTLIEDITRQQVVEIVG